MIRNWIIRKLTARTRKIFRFWDGRKYRAVDPMVVFRKLSENTEFAGKDDLVRLKYPDTTTRLKAYALVADAVRDAFSIPVFDGTAGLTETELVGLYFQFDTEMHLLKKNMKQPAASLPSSDHARTSSEEPAASATSNSSASGLTAQPA